MSALALFAMPALGLVVPGAQSPRYHRAAAVRLATGSAWCEASPRGGTRGMTASIASPEGPVVRRLTLQAAPLAPECLEAETARLGRATGVGPSRSSVLALLSGCRPSAVLGRVGTVVVDAVDGCPPGFGPHVLDERHEPATTKPPVADSDASAPVHREVLGPRTGASLDHPAPCRISGPGRLADSRGLPVDTVRETKLAGPLPSLGRSRVGDQPRLAHRSTPVQEQRIAGVLNANV